MEVQVEPIDNAIIFSCDCWAKVRADNVNHSELERVLDYIEKYLPDHSDLENMWIYILRLKETSHRAYPEFSLLLVHEHFEHPNNSTELQVLTAVVGMMEQELCEHIGGHASVRYLNMNREKMIIELEGITDYDLIQEIVTRGGGWKPESSVQNSSISSGEPSGADGES